MEYEIGPEKEWWHTYLTTGKWTTMTQNKGAGLKPWGEKFGFFSFHFEFFTYSLTSPAKKELNWSINHKKGALCTVTHDLLWELTSDACEAHTLASTKTTPYTPFPLAHARTHTCMPTTNMKILYLKAILHLHEESMSLQYITSRGQARPGPD